MPPSRNNTVRFTDLQAISSVNAGDIIPVVDTSVPTLVNKKINVQDFSRSLPVSQQVTQMGAVSANWNSSYSTTLANSASWSTGGSYGSVYSANSAEYESAYSSVNTNSANWDSTYNTVQTSSAAWTGLTTYTTVNSLSNNWNSGFSAYSSFNTLSTGYWLLKAGDQVTGSLTTTKTLTTQFTDLNEFITKRYADSLAAASQISGNFVPSLYYTKNETDTGFVSRTNAIINPTWNNASTVFTALSVNVIRTAADNNSLLANFILNGESMARFGGTGTGGASLILGDGRGTVTTNGNSIMLRSGVGGGWPYLFSPSGYILVGGTGVGSTPGIAFSLQDPGFNLPSVYLTLDNDTNLAIRNGSIPQALRVYNNYVNSTTNFERFSLSGNRLAYELSGSQRFYINPAPNPSNVNNVALSWNSGSGILTIDPYNSIDWQFARNGSASHVLRAGGTFETRVLGAGLTIDVGTGIIGGILFEAADTVGIRNSTNSQNLRVYNTYTNATNYERLSLSATRIAYEFAGTGVARDLTISTPGNLVLSGAAISFNTATPFNFGTISLSADRIRLPRINAISSDPHISIAFNDNMYWLSDGANYVRTGAGPSIIFGSYADQGGFATRINGAANTFNFWLTRDSSICWNPGNPNAGFTETGDLFMFRDEPYVLAIRDRQSQTGTNALRIYNTYISSSEYTRMSLSGSRIAFERVGTPPAYANYDGSSIRGGHYGGIAFYSGNTWVGQFPGQGGDFHLSTTKEFRWGFGEQAWNYDLSLARDAADTLALRRSTNPNAFRIYNTYTDANNYERLSLSATRIAYEAAGTGVSRDLTIQSTGNIILSAGGAVNISQSLPTMFNALSARNLVVGPSDSSTGSVLRVPTSSGSTGIPGIIAYANNASTVPTTVPDSRISIATFGGMGYQNTSSIYAPHILTNRIIASNASPVLDPNHWDDVSLKVAGKIGFTTQSLDASSKVRPLSATMEYDWSTNLISLSSSAGKVGFRFESVDGTPMRPEIYNDGSLTITSNFGGGRLIYFKGVNNQGWNPMTLNAYGAFVYGKMEITATQQTGTGYGFLPYLNILQDNKQLSSYIRAVNSAGTTVFEVNSANNVSVQNLLTLGGTTSAACAIKGSGTTVVAKLGDDSDYAYLQGKLQTLNTAAAGTFTPDKYLILYDSTGTAYKVPVQAL